MRRFDELRSDFLRRMTGHGGTITVSTEEQYTKRKGLFSARQEWRVRRVDVALWEGPLRTYLSPDGFSKGVESSRFGISLDGRIWHGLSVEGSHRWHTVWSEELPPRSEKTLAAWTETLAWIVTKR